MISSIMNKFYREFIRNKISIGLVFAFPLFFLIIFNVSFGGTVITSGSTYDIAVINDDSGIPGDIAAVLNNTGFPQNWIEDGIGKNLTDIIFDMRYEEDGKALFNRVVVDRADIDSAIENELSLVMIIPENFSLSILNILNNNAKLRNQSSIPFLEVVSATIDMYGDERSQAFDISKTILQNLINTFIGFIGDVDFETGSIIINTESILPVREDITIFDFIASGIFVFATILSTSYFAGLVLTDEENGVMDRYKVSLINPQKYTIAFSIFAFAIMMIQAVFLLASAYFLFGFKPAGSFIYAFIILVLLSLANLGFIFTAGAFFKSSDTAGSVIGFASSILGFASGSFMNMPKIVLIKNILPFTSGSPDLLLWDLLPWTHANNALKLVLLLDYNLSEVIGDLILLVIMGIVWYIIGLYYYSKRRFAIEV